MISIYKIKPAFQKLLKPILNLLYKIGISANQITISSILLSLLIGISFWYAEQEALFFLCVPVGLLFRMALNALDGMMARQYNQQSKLGEVLNEVGDIVSDFFIYLPLIKFFPEQLYYIIVFLSLSILNEFSGVMAKIISGNRRYDGPMGKSDRAFIVSLISILLFFDIGLSSYMSWVFFTITLLLFVSTYKRLSGALSNAE
ncbi:MAG: CDP-alcohol phosphatidyltransferase family protein [Balneolaceae bacterium]